MTDAEKITAEFAKSFVESEFENTVSFKTIFFNLIVTDLIKIKLAQLK